MPIRSIRKVIVRKFIIQMIHRVVLQPALEFQRQTYLQYLSSESEKIEEHRESQIYHNAKWADGLHDKQNQMKIRTGRSLQSTYSRHHTQPCDPEADKTSHSRPHTIVLQSELNTLHNYFHLLHSLFGKTNTTNNLLKHLPCHEEIAQQHLSATQKTQTLSSELQFKLESTRTNIPLERLHTQSIGLESTRPERKQPLFKRKNPYSKGEIIKGNARSKHSLLMQKLQSPTQKLLAADSVPTNCPIPYDQTENFVPLGPYSNSVQKYSLLGVKLENDRSLIRMSMCAPQEIKYRTHRSDRKQHRRFKSETTEMFPRTVFTAERRTKNGINSKKMSMSVAQQRGRDKQFSPWDPSSIQY